MAERGISQFPNLTAIDNRVCWNHNQRSKERDQFLVIVTQDIQTMKCVLIFAALIQVSLGFSVYKSSLISLERCQSQGSYAKMKSITLISRSMSKDGDDFWESQRRLAASIADTVDQEDKEIRLSAREAYNKRVFDLVLETFYFSILIFAAIWALVPNPFTGISYLLGALLGTAYTYGLGKYVETLGGSAYDVDDVKGSGVGSARFAFLILLFIFVGKFRSQGLQEIPAIMGFFTYQLSSLSQGLKESAED